MAGHSKWANIKRRKAVVDAKRGKTFTKASKEIIVAARLGGGDVEGNPRLRMAVLNARSISMPADNIKRAILRGTGDVEGANYEEMMYEGYGPGGVALIIECTSENRNRTVADLRAIMARNEGNLGEPNSVAWNFVRKGELRATSVLSEDQLTELALDAGADDVQVNDVRQEADHRNANANARVAPQRGAPVDARGVVFYCATDVLAQCSVALTANGLDIQESRFIYEAINTIAVSDADVARKLLKLLDAIEDNDDVQNVYNNADIADDVLAALDES